MPTVDDAIRLIREIDDKIDTIEREAKEKTNALKTKRSTLEVWLNKKALEDGVDSFRTNHGTAFWTTTAYCSVADWDAIWNHIQKHEAWELLTHAVSKKAIAEIVSNTGVVPPGLNYGTKKTLNIRKPSATV